MKIVLVHPSNEEVYKNLKNVMRLDKSKAKTPPIGLAYIAGVLQSNRYDVKILDAEASNLNLAQTADRIVAEKPDMVGMTCTTPLINISLKIARKVKEKLPSVKIVLGGPHITALPLENLNKEEVDYIILGEGEYSFLELVEALASKKDVGKIKGIGYKDQSGAHFSTRPLIENLDEVPFPARNLLGDYFKDCSGRKFTLMISSRGCPYRCIFCGSSITFGNKTRFRSPKNVISEIKDIGNRKIKEITFNDDTFTLNKKRTIEICKGICKEGLQIPFICSSRVNTIDGERAKWLKKAGCYQISFGVESGNQGILNLMKKGITLEQAEKAILLTKKEGIETYASYVIGLPGESKETIQQTIDFAKKLDTDYAQFSIATPFPGTELWSMAKEKIKDMNFSKFTWYYSPVFEIEGMTTGEIIEIQRKAYEDYKKGRQGKND